MIFTNKRSLKQPATAIISGLIMTLLYALLVTIFFQHVRYADNNDWVQKLMASYYDVEAIGQRVLWDWLFTACAGIIMGWQYRSGGWGKNLFSLILTSFSLPLLIMVLTEDLSIAQDTPALFFLPLQLTVVMLLSQTLGWLLAAVLFRIKHRRVLHRSTENVKHH